ncbi:Transmembrane_domain-containing protein [Hexamita inflata]|uniref:Transmembrane domain-containing protein n=1 Tax=Hexamita inflata TaxID=28002 RepID=A0AA86QEX1_9EUKA|nr:Transmembrane domain-containing protein [Hexamita inflata]
MSSEEVQFIDKQQRKNINNANIRHHYSIINKAFRPLKDFIHPQSVKEFGCKRLVSIDFLRGISIFVMLAGHEFADIMASDADSNILYYIIGVPLGLVGGFRIFFILISGISHAYVFASSSGGKSASNVLVGLFVQLFGSFLAIPLFYLFHVCNVMCGDFANGTLEVSKQWFKKFGVWSHPPIFFGLSQPVNCVVLILIYVLIMVPMQRNKKIKRQHIYWTISAICFVVSVIHPFIFMNISNGLRKSMAKATGLNPETDFKGSDRECPGNAFGGWYVQTIQTHFQYIFYHFNAGTYMQMNCMYMFFMMGLSLGFVIVAFKHQKQQIMQEKAENYKLQYKKLKRNYYLYLGLSPIIILICELLVHVQVKAQVKSGVRTFRFGFAEYFKTLLPPDCYVPEYNLAAMCVQMWLVFLAILLFDGTTNAKAKKRAERILYLRRFSSLSFSCFVFGYALSQPIRNLLQIEAGKTYIWDYIGYIIMYFVITLLVHCTFDTFGDRMTPDWAIKRFGHIFSFKDKFTDVSEQHLNVDPINLFEKLE